MGRVLQSGEKSFAKTRRLHNLVAMRKMNDSTVLPGLRPKGVKALLTCMGLVLVLSLPATAGTEMTKTDMKEITPPSCCCSEKDWTIELGSGLSWSNVRSG